MHNFLENVNSRFDPVTLRINKSEFFEIVTRGIFSNSNRYNRRLFPPDVSDDLLNKLLRINYLEIQRNRLIMQIRSEIKRTDDTVEK